MKKSEDQEPLSRINNAGKHLLNLINDILDLSKIEAGKMELYLESIFISDIVTEIRAMAEPLALKNNNEFKINLPDDTGKMHTDVTKLKQILLNLISNSSKFACGGEVSLGIEADTIDDVEWVKFIVADTGIGMSAEELSHVFEEFSQADASTTRQYGGTGLGLPICQKMSHMMGGQILVESEKGKGTTSTVLLPRDSSVDLQQEDQEVFENKKSVPEASTIKSVPLPEASPDVIIIEDDPDARNMLRHYLESEDYSVLCEEDGESGLNAVRVLKPKVLILDIELPSISGWDILSLLKSDADTRDIEIIVISIIDEKHKGYALGASDYLIKPVSHQDLIAVVSKHINFDDSKKYPGG